MLSYILPVAEKPPAGKRLQLDLASPPPSSPEDCRRGRRALARPSVAPPPPPSAISKESSTSSFASSDLTGSSMTPTGPVHEKPKHKLLSNGAKHTGLKRVSFGSSKGSMVETLIYESPLAEEPESSPVGPHRSHETSFPYSPPVVASPPSELDSERSKVRVSFYQGVRPQCIPPAPPNTDHETNSLLATLLATSTDAEMASAATAVVVDGTHTHFNRQISTESGWDNPFRPDGDLSREADEIVSLIKGGKPITPTPNVAQQLPSVDETDKHTNIANTPESPASKVTNSKLNNSPPPKGVNGTKNGNMVSPGQVEIQRTAPPEPQQAEHIVLKKKPKCKCCVVQ